MTTNASATRLKQMMTNPTGPPLPIVLNQEDVGASALVWVSYIVRTRLFIELNSLFDNYLEHEGDELEISEELHP